MIGPAGMITAVALSGCNSQAVLGFLCAALFLNGAITSGAYVNITDVSPVFSGTNHDHSEVFFII